MFQEHLLRQVGTDLQLSPLDSAYQDFCSLEGPCVARQRRWASTDSRLVDSWIGAKTTA